MEAGEGGGLAWDEVEGWGENSDNCNGTTIEKSILILKIHLSHHTCQNGYHQLMNKQQVLAWMWRKGNSASLLVGMHIGATTVESSMEKSQNIKNGSAL